MGTFARIEQALKTVQRSEGGEDGFLATVSMPSNEVCLSWILGGRQGKWGVSSYMPCPPKPKNAEDDTSLVVSMDLSSDKEGVANQGHSQDKERVHLLRVGSFLVKVQHLWA